MASVRMTIALKERLTETYKKQCQTAYNSSLNVDSTVKTIVEAIQTLDRPGSGTADAREFTQLVETAEQMQRLLDAHSVKYKNLYESSNRYGVANGSISNCSDSGYGNTAKRIDNLPILMAKQLHIVCNPNRPATENMTTIQGWRTSFTERWNEKLKDPSDNYIEGDTLFIHDFGDEPVYLPFITEGDEQHYQSVEGYAPYAGLGIVITDPDMCVKLQAIPMAKQKVSDMVEKFKDFVEPITTLKKFLDEFPGGKSLVPEDVLQTMAAPAKKRAASSTVQAKDLLTPDQKQEFNEVMLESSLLGGKND